MVSNFKIQNMPSLSVQVSQFSPKPMFSMLNFTSRLRILPQFRASIPIMRMHSLSLSSSPSPSPSPSPLYISENSSNEHPFEVSYLINTFGWPPKFAISKAKNLKFKTPERPERVMTFLMKHGFSETQISHIVKKLPVLLLCNPEDTLLPKLEFLSSLGLSKTEITSVVAKEPNILKRSLEKILVPSYNLIRYLVKSDDEAVRLVKRYPIVLTHKPEVDNVQILLKEGVPRENIAASLIYTHWHTVPPDKYRKMVEEVKQMGFDPCRKNFLCAIRSIRSLSKATWEDKVQVFKRYGWSDREILLAFEKSPNFIMSSKDKIVGVMDFLGNVMGIEAKTVANFPVIIAMSLEKRVIPRCLVYQSLMEKGLYKRKCSIVTLCTFSEDRFLNKFVKPYENKAPELWDLYKSPFTHLKREQLNRAPRVEV